MLSYILLFSLIALVILGIIRASKQKQPGGTRLHREPFVGIAQDEIADEVETVGEVRVISRASTPAFTALDQRQEAVAEVPQSFVTPKKQASSVTQAAINVPPLLELKPAPSQSAVTLGKKFDDVIVLHVLANSENLYRGYELLQALLAAKLRYGKWNIFHRHEEITGRGPILFSLASSVNPGTFDLAKIDGFSTPGLTLFMRVSDLKNPAQTFEILLSTAKSLAEELGGAVCDEKRFPLSSEKLAAWHAQLNP